MRFNEVQWGPILDKRGVEQGGVTSGDQFQLVNNEELIVTNTAGLGLDMGETKLLLFHPKGDHYWHDVCPIMIFVIAEKASR